MMFVSRITHHAIRLKIFFRDHLAPSIQRRGFKSPRARQRKNLLQAFNGDGRFPVGEIFKATRQSEGDRFTEATIHLTGRRQPRVEMEIKRERRFG